MNWGKGIILAFVFFISFIFFMLYKISNQTYDLVEDDYYLKEMDYESKMDAKQNTENLALDKPKIMLKENNVTIKFSSLNTLKKGDVQFYHPSDQKYDRIYEFDSKDTLLIFSTVSLVKGKYILKLNWEDTRGNKYFQQENIWLDK